MNDHTRARRTAAVLIAAAFAAGCDGTVTEAVDDINPGLLQGDGGIGVASSGGTTLPQGAAAMVGPGGMPLDATGEEFVQQLTLHDGTVLRSSGIYIRAVPDESVTGAPFRLLVAGSGLTGSMASVGPGTYEMMPEWPPMNYIDEVPVTWGKIHEPGSTSLEYVLASSGTFTIESVRYFEDEYPCENPPASASMGVDECTDRIGILTGSFSMTATLSTGALVQEPTRFTLPIRRRLIVAHIIP